MLGLFVKSATQEGTEVVRRTKETEVICKVKAGERGEWKIDTGVHFLDHMIETLAYYVEFNIDLKVKTSKSILIHTIVEDSGITLGRAFLEILKKRMGRGVRGFGFAQCVLDEAFVQARVSYEGRAGCYITRGTRRFTMVEDVKEEFMESFFQGFAQGMRLTVHLDLMRAEDPHHLWEAAFRAFGEALRQALQWDEWRKGGIAGIRGTDE